MIEEKPRCCYLFENGHRCEEEPTSDGHCYWHSTNITKDQDGDKERLEAWAKSGKSMEGFSLKYAKLDHVNLVNYGSKEGYDLSKADLYHADLTGAHLFNANLSGSSLMKADLSHANLNSADLTGVNLLGTIFDNTKIEHTKWCEEIRQEIEAENAFRKESRDAALDLHEQAEEIYRNLRKATEARGQFENAGHFFYKEMIMRRRQMNRWTMPWAFSKLVDIFCGYGEKPIRVVLFSLGLIFVCSIFYALIGIHQGGYVIAIRPDYDFVQNIINFLDCLYFSVITFTTVGYGDMTPFGWSKPVAGFEAFVGSFTLALFVVVFVKKMTR